MGKLLSVAGAFAGVRLLTEFLSPEEYGKLALGMTVVTFANQFVMGPLANGAMRFYAPAVEANGLVAYTDAIRKMTRHATMLLLLVFPVMSASLWITGKKDWIVIGFIALLLAILSGYNGICNGIQNAARQRIVVALHNAALSWFKYLVAVLLLIAMPRGSVVALAGFTVVTLLILVSQLWFLNKRVPLLANSNPAEAHKWQLKAWHYSWPFAVWGLFTCMHMASDRWALGAFASTRDIGLYAVVYQLGYVPIVMLVEMAIQLLAPVIFARVGDGSDISRRRHARMICGGLTMVALACTSVVFCIGFKFHPLIFSLLTATGYRSASYLFPWMLLGGGLFAAGQTISLIMMAELNTKSLARIKVGTAIAGTIMNIGGAYLFGIKGVVFSFVCFSIIYILWVAFFSGSKSNRCESIMG